MFHQLVKDIREIGWKYTRNTPSKLGEKENSIRISTYFTQPAYRRRSVVYFHCISQSVFLISSSSQI